MESYTTRNYTSIYSYTRVSEKSHHVLKLTTSTNLRVYGYEGIKTPLLKAKHLQDKLFSMRNNMTKRYEVTPLCLIFTLRILNTILIQELSGESSLWPVFYFISTVNNIAQL